MVPSASSAGWRSGDTVSSPFCLRDVCTQNPHGQSPILVGVGPRSSFPGPDTTAKVLLRCRRLDLVPPRWFTYATTVMLSDRRRMWELETSRAKDLIPYSAASISGVLMWRVLRPRSLQCGHNCNMHPTLSAVHLSLSRCQWFEALPLSCSTCGGCPATTAGLLWPLWSSEFAGRILSAAELDAWGAAGSCNVVVLAVLLRWLLKACQWSSQVGEQRWVLISRVLTFSHGLPVQKVRVH